jgi:hypothetical protein
MPAINLSPLTAEQEALDRRRKMAEAMQQQAILPIEMPNVPGAKVSHLQGFAKLLQGYIAGKNLERAEEEKKQYEADTMGDFAKILRNTGKYETIPGTPAVPEQTTDVIEPNIANQNLQAVAARQMTRDPNAPISPFERQIGMDERAQISQLPMESTQTRVTPAVAAVPDRQVPLLSPELLSDPNFMKTSSGRMMLAQALMQQQAQEQAEALRKREAEQAIVKFGPEDTTGRIVDGKFVPLVIGKPKIEYTKVEMRDPATGQPMIKYVDKTKLGELGNILAPYTGMIADLVQAQNLPAAIQNNPEALRLIGGFLGKQGGDVTAADFAKVMIGLDETNARLRNESIPPVTTDIVRPKNIMIQSKPLPPEGSPLENGQVYDTSKGQARWNGTKFVTIN